jgi:hypothetical protein
VLFALLLPRLAQHGTARHVAGVSIAALLLLIQPSIYSTPTQMNGFNLATLVCLAAFSILHWTFSSSTAEQQPTVLQVCLSTFTHALDGVCKVHQRFLARQSKHKNDLHQSLARNRNSSRGPRLTAADKSVWSRPYCWCQRIPQSPFRLVVTQGLLKALKGSSAQNCLSCGTKTAATCSTRFTQQNTRFNCSPVGKGSD